VKEIIDSEIVLCDVSANNTNALYALAVRHVLGLPVTIIKDTKSVVPFGMSDMGVVEYDESLRIDTVQKATETISEAMKHAVETKTAKHELLDRLGIGLPPVETPALVFETNVTTTVTEEPSEVDEKKKEVRLPIISPLPDYVGDPFTEEQINELKAGDVFFHLNHGKGKVNFVKKSGKENLASIQFDSGTKLLVLVATDFFRKINK
jgi:hypothetical protein